MSRTDPTPLIHFLIPHFGSAAYLRDGVESIIRQSDPSWRLTVVEDGANDHGLAAWVASHEDPRIELVTNTHRLGINANFQRCLDLAEAPYVAFPGNDDLLLPDYVAHVRRTINRFPQARVIQPGVEVIDSRGGSCRPLPDRIKSLLRPSGSGTQELFGEAVTASLLQGNWTYFPSLCWQRTAVQSHRFRPDLPTTLDLALLLDVLRDGSRLVVTSDPVFRYRRHRGSASSSAAASTERFLEESRLFEEAAVDCHRAGWESACRAARWHVTSRLHALTRVPAHLRAGNLTRARVSLSHTFAPARHRSLTTVGRS